MREHALSFDPNIARVSPPAYLVGYWGSARYFSDIGERLRAELALAEPMDSADEARAHQIRSCNSVSMHVRRGDYLAARQKALFGLLPLDYYQQAISYLDQRLEAPRFYIFSDNMAWCRENIRMEYAHEFVSSTARHADGVDLALLSLCRHHIVANSTFSWWGA